VFARLFQSSDHNKNVYANAKATAVTRTNSPKTGESFPQAHLRSPDRTIISRRPSLIFIRSVRGVRMTLSIYDKYRKTLSTHHFKRIIARNARDDETTRWTVYFEKRAGLLWTDDTRTVSARADNVIFILVCRFCRKIRMARRTYIYTVWQRCRSCF